MSIFKHGAGLAIAAALGLGLLGSVPAEAGHSTGTWKYYPQGIGPGYGDGYGYGYRHRRHGYRYGYGAPVYGSYGGCYRVPRVVYDQWGYPHRRHVRVCN